MSKKKTSTDTTSTTPPVMKPAVEQLLVAFVTVANKVQKDGFRVPPPS